MATKISSKKKWSIFFIILLGLIVIGFIAYAIGYQYGSKMLSEQASINVVYTWISL